MPSRREIADAVALLTGGRIAQAAYGAATTIPQKVVRFQDLTRRQQARAIATTGVRGAKFGTRQAITKNPWGVAALLAYEGYIHRDEIADLAESLGAGEVPGGGAPSIVKKRALSKANRAVAYGMKLLKAGSKGSTGAPKGELAKGSFKVATQAAGLANPKTGGSTKGKGKTKALARKIRSWW